MQVNLSNKTSIMSSVDWSNALGLILGNMGYLAGTPTETDLLSFIVARTLRFNKIADLYRLEWLLHGKLSLGLLPFTVTRQAIWKARKALEERNVLVFARKGKGVSGLLSVCINLPGIARYFEPIFKAQKPLQLLPEDRRAARQNVEFCQMIAEKSSQIWRAMNLEPVEVKTMASMQALIEEGYEKSRAAREKFKDRQQKRVSLFVKKKAQLSASWVFQTMEDICDELGLTYFDGLNSDKEWKMARGSARNFLSYCQRDGKNPYDVLYSVVENWTKFNHKVLTMKNGEPALFSNVVDFMTFFRYRDQIMQFILQQEKTCPEPTQSDSSSSDIDAELAAFAARPDFC